MYVVGIVFEYLFVPVGGDEQMHISLLPGNSIRNSHGHDGYCI